MRINTKNRLVRCEINGCTLTHTPAGQPAVQLSDGTWVIGNEDEARQAILNADNRPMGTNSDNWFRPWFEILRAKGITSKEMGISPG